jgi:hypothetical protein
MKQPVNQFAELIAFVAFASVVVAASSPSSAVAAQPDPSAASPAAAPKNPIPAEQAAVLYIAFNDLMQGPMNNIGQMWRALVGGKPLTAELTAASSIDEISHRAVEPLGYLLQDAFIYQGMKCDSDRAVVLAWMPPNLNYTKGQLDRAIEGINGQLVYITNHALLLEAQAVRDGLQKLRSALEPYSYDPR